MKNSLLGHGVQRHPQRPALAIAFSVFYAVMFAPHAARAATCTVTSTSDSGAAGTLRGCLNNPSLADGDTIDATGVSGTVLLTSGPLEVNRNVTILGPGPGTLAINGNATSRVFEVHGSPFHNGDVVISGLTITNGIGNNNNNTDGGGGIYNDDMVGTLRLDNCTV